MKVCLDCNGEKPLHEFGRLSVRCKECAVLRRKRKMKEADDRYRKAHPERIRESNARFYRYNKEREKKRVQEWRDKNRDRVAASSKAWRQTPEGKERRRQYRAEIRERNNAQQRERYAANPEASLSVSRAWKAANRERDLSRAREYYRTNPDINRRNQARRRARILQATPAWADFDKINAIYLKAAQLTRKTGITRHVDHHYPLVSKLMCGLHVETNLRILTGTENQRKKNRIPQDDLSSVI